MVAAGIALVPEGRRLFGQMTVMDNLRMGAYARHARASEESRLAGVLAMFPRLAERRGQLANTMSGGEQQMVAIARALMSGPKQSVRQSLRLADFVHVLENGRIVRSGSPDEIESDKAIQKAYLGLAAKPSRVAANVRAVEEVTAAGGFSHPYSRSVAWAPVTRSTMDRRPMDVVAGAAGAGFFHPFARSVAPPRMAPARSVEAPVPTRVDIPAIRTEKRPATGGFVNPYAINPQMQLRRRAAVNQD
jgi:branched-chain amino acid transport system ATP-binding protein